MALQIDYGERLKLGIMLPSGNSIAEPQIHAMLPPGVAALITRLELRGSSVQELLAMSSQVASGAALLADAQVDEIIFHCTAVSTYSVALGQEIEAQLEQLAGSSSFSTGSAIVAALKALQAKKIVLLTPYLPEVNARESAFLEQHGCQVLDQVGLGINTNSEMALLEPQIWFDLALAHQHPEADAYFISCTAVKSLEVVEKIEARLGRPVITSNQAMVWYALRKHSIDDARPGCGRLFELPLAP